MENCDATIVRFKIYRVVLFYFDLQYYIAYTRFYSIIFSFYELYRLTQFIRVFTQFFVLNIGKQKDHSSWLYPIYGNQLPDATLFYIMVLFSLLFKHCVFCCVLDPLLFFYCECVMSYYLYCGGICAITKKTLLIYHDIFFLAILYV